MRITLDRYNAMQERLKRKKLPPSPFTLDQLRHHFLAALGGSSNGVIQCVYCWAISAPEDCAIDHIVPLSRGGALGLENIGFLCAACNDRKGQMLPEEYTELLQFLDRQSPTMRRDVLDRLGKAVKLMAGSTHLRGRVAKLQDELSEARK